VSNDGSSTSAQTRSASDTVEVVAEAEGSAVVVAVVVLAVVGADVLDAEGAGVFEQAVITTARRPGRSRMVLADRIPGVSAGWGPGLSGNRPYPGPMPGASYYAEAFAPMSGRCFRLVDQQGEGGPTHCREPVVWRGPWRTPSGRRYRVEACEIIQALSGDPRTLAAGRPVRSVSPQGIDFIKGWEEFRARMYDDPVGH